jgi:hypothetical protein
MMHVNCVLEMYSSSVDISHYVFKNYCIIVSAICGLNCYFIVIRVITIIIVIVVIIIITIIVILLFFDGGLKSVWP